MKTTQLEFNLQDAIDNPSKAPAIVKAVQAAFTELSNASLAALEAATESKNTALAYENQVRLLTQSNVSMSEAMKNVYIVLNSKRELWATDPDMKGLMDGLGTFVVSSGSIKMGVLNEKGINSEQV